MPVSVWKPLSRQISWHTSTYFQAHIQASSCQHDFFPIVTWRNRKMQLEKRWRGTKCAKNMIKKRFIEILTWIHMLGFPRRCRLYAAEQRWQGFTRLAVLYLPLSLYAAKQRIPWRGITGIQGDRTGKQEAEQEYPCSNLACTPLANFSPEFSLVPRYLWKSWF